MFRRVLISPDIDPEGLVAQRYGVGEGGGSFVIRPDGYIGARPGNPSQLQAYLAGIG